MAQCLRKYHDFLKLLVKCTPAQRKGGRRFSENHLRVCLKRTKRDGASQ